MLLPVVFADAAADFIVLFEHGDAGAALRESAGCCETADATSDNAMPIMPRLLRDRNRGLPFLYGHDVEDPDIVEWERDAMERGDQERNNEIGYRFLHGR